MGRFEDLSGRRFGRLLVLWRDLASPNVNVHWTCVCDCGNQKSICGQSMKNGRSASCGCLHHEFMLDMGHVNHIHGHSNPATRTYTTWQGMKARCLNPKNTRYADYGGRGIKICQHWLDAFENFLADMGEKPIGMSIDRINNDGHYEPSNCRWATNEIQMKNRRKHYSRKGTNYGNHSIR